MHHNYTPPTGVVTAVFGADAQIGGLILDNRTVMSCWHMTRSENSVLFMKDGKFIGSREIESRLLVPAGMPEGKADGYYWTLKDPIPDEWVKPLVRPEVGAEVVVHCALGHLKHKIVSIGERPIPDFQIDMSPEGFDAIPFSGSVVTQGDAIIGFVSSSNGENQTNVIYPAERFPILGDRAGRIKRLAFRPSENSVFAVGVTSGRAIKGEIRILDNIDFGWLVSPGNLQRVIDGRVVAFIGEYKSSDLLSVENIGGLWYWEINGRIEGSDLVVRNARNQSRSIINLDRWESNHAQGLVVEFEDVEPAKPKPVVVEQSAGKDSTEDQMRIAIRNARASLDRIEVLIGGVK